MNAFVIGCFLPLLAMSKYYYSSRLLIEMSSCEVECKSPGTEKETLCLK